MTTPTASARASSAGGEALSGAAQCAACSCTTRARRRCFPEASSLTRGARAPLPARGRRSTGRPESTNT
eukprot:6317332-Alexandrium_andersonii.AAC.1